MELTEEALVNCLKQIVEHAADTGDDIRPRYMLISWDNLRLMDRLINQWKGNRAAWLMRKRGNNGVH